MRWILLALALAAGSAQAEEPPARLEVLPGWLTESGTRMIGLRLVLAPGWKTYWRSPGEAGIPPTVSFQGSRNVKGAEFHWPAPGVYDVAGLRTIGYTHEVVLPLEITPAQAGRTTKLRGTLSVGVCSDVCVPMDFPLRLDLDGPGAPSPLIAAALAAQPKAVEAGSLATMACRIDPIADGLRVTAVLALASQGGDEAAVFEHRDPSLWVSQADVTRRGDRLKVAADIVPVLAKPFALDRSGLRLTVIGTDRATEIRGCPAG